jgi:hypothetical protein
MNFKQALQELLNGKKIRRKCWENKHYWCLDDDGYLVNSIGENPEINKYQLIDTISWEVYQENEILKELENSANKLEYGLKKLMEDLNKLLKEISNGN